MLEQSDMNVVKTLAAKIHTESIVWIVISVFQILSVVGIACAGRDAAGGSMGLLKEALLLQSIHLGSDGRARIWKMVFLQQGLATDRLGGLDEVFDDEL